MTVTPGEPAGEPETVERRKATTRPRGMFATRPRRIAALAGAVWAVVVLSYAIGFTATLAETRGTAALDLLFFAAVLVLPMGLFWLAALLSDELALLRRSVAQLSAALPALSSALAASRVYGPTERGGSTEEITRAVREALAGAAPPDEPALRRLAEGQDEIRAGLRALAERPGTEILVPASPDPASPDLASPAGPPAEGPRAMEETGGPAAAALAPGILIRALDFPRDAEDRDGFRALQAAHRHSSVSHALRAAEDLLTLLSEIGVYMDDLDIAPVEPHAWRRYVTGARGPDTAAAGGVADAEVLDKTRELMERDPIFRDTAQHFIRRFDAILAEFAPELDDESLRALIETRSGRAFTLLARLRGRFGVAAGETA